MIPATHRPTFLCNERRKVGLTLLSFTSGSAFFASHSIGTRRINEPDDQLNRERLMDRMLVVIFPNERKAYDGRTALQQLDSEGSISVYACAVLVKNPDGTATVKQGDDVGPIGTLVGTSLGSLLGVLGGPVGVLAGATAGMAAGSTIDLNNTRVGADFIDDVQKRLVPPNVALVAEVDEEWTTPVDTRMEAIGGTVFRRALSEVAETVDDEDVAAMKADLAQLKAERAKVQADRKAKLEEKINQLDSKIQAQLQAAKERHDAAKRKAQAKAELLKVRADPARSKAS